MDHMPTLTHATERDVDLLLIEELQCSWKFVSWVTQKIGKTVGRPIEHRSSSVLHSKRRVHNRREIDIMLNVVGSTGTTACLIENKLDTSEQPQQAESYREEADTLVRSNLARAAFTVLICPRAYAEKCSEFAQRFDSTIMYEDVVGFLRARSTQETGELAERLIHRCALLEQAITKARRGYEAVPMEEIGNFSAQYVALLRSRRIDLQPGTSMLKAGPGESKTMIFANGSLPAWPFLPQTRLVHQLREGNANICLYGWGNHFSRLAGVIGPDLDGTPYRVVPTINKRANGNSGLMIVCDTPKIDNLASFSDQEASVVVGMEATLALKLWFSNARASVQRWAQVVPKIQ